MVRFSSVVASITVLATLALPNRSSAVPAASTGHATHGPAVSAVRAGHKRSASSGYVYVSNQLTFAPPISGSIAYFPAGSSGNVAPAGIISGSNTLLTQTNGIAVDSGGEIWAAQSDTNSIVGFAPGSNGNVAPNAIISGSNTGLASPVGMTVDGAGNLYVVNCAECQFGPPGTTSVEEFAAGSSGNVSPIRTISGKRTQLDRIEGIALDAAGSLYIANSLSSEVLVFRRRAHGNAQPERVLAAAHVPVGLAIIGNDLFVTAVYQDAVSRYSRKASGDARPRSSFTVSWPANPSGQSLAGVAGAPDGSVFVAGFYAPLIAQYAADSRGKAQPLALIEGSNTGLVLPTFVFVK